MRVRTLAIALAAAALLTNVVVPPAAFADGDPASDVLLGQNVFYPYSPPVSGSVQKSLDAETAAAKKAGLPIKVALIGSPVDLGVIPALFGQPQKYADFLDQEISFHTKQPLLVVMPAGYGVQGLSAKANRALASLPKPAGTKTDALATAAIAAVAKLAAAEGRPLAAASGSSSSSGSSSTTLIVAILAVAAVATAAALLVLRRRQTASR
jgi:hypothetical protein